MTSCAGRSRAHSAISSASSGSSVGIGRAVRQPTIRRENTSVTNAVNAIPDHVGDVGEVDHPQPVRAGRRVKSRFDQVRRPGRGRGPGGW